ncbi:MAG TPA: hypothetical protein PKL54_05705 [Candidatus Hydrogenedentes bacterium]|nr:hypothetical protein [Candidatus Hydrogenedentota bacterium]
MPEPGKVKNTGVYLRLLALAAVMALAAAAGLWVGKWSVPEEAAPVVAPVAGAGAQGNGSTGEGAEGEPGTGGPPLYFFARPDAPEDWATVMEEASMAAEAGISRHIVPVAPVWSDEDAPDDVTARLKQVMAANPRASFLLQVDLNPPPAWAKAHEGEMMTVNGAPGPFPSTASQQWIEDGRAALRKLVESVEGGEVSRRIEGYVLCALEGGQWTLPEAGDRSEVNRQGFRDWLVRHYQGEAALGEAWGRPGMSADEVTLPELPDFNNTGQVFVRFPEDRPLSDYLRYTSESTADALAAFVAHLVEVSMISPSILAPYGFSFEAGGNVSGHFALGNLLDSDLGGVIGPVSQSDRGMGGAGGYAGPVHSLLARGKTWIVLDDTRTGMERDPATGAVARMRGVRAEDIFEVQKRNFASALVDGLGLAWADPLGDGWLLDREQWRLFGKMREVCAARAEQAAAPPEEESPAGVTVVVDEASRAVQRCAGPLNALLVAGGRDAALRAGVRTRFVLLQDVLEERAGPSRVWLFLNAFRIDAEARERLHDRFARERASVVWLYAPGYFDGDVSSAENIAAVTGMGVRAFEGAAAPGSLFSLSGQFLAQDAPFGAAGSWDPLFHIEDEGADALARYAESGKTSLAVKSVNGEWTSIYLADPGVGPAILAEILRILEEPLFIAPGEANYFDPVYAGPGLLALHGAESGKRSVLLPDYCDVQDLFDPAVGWAQKDEFVLPLRTGETRVFSLKPMGQGPR